VAEAIAGELKAGGFEAAVLDVKERAPGDLTGDVLFIGSPTRGGKMTGSTMEPLEGLNVEYWKGKDVIAFDTLGPLSKDMERRRQLGSIDAGKNAATTIRKAGEERGLSFHPPQLLHFAVVGMWGPLAPDALELAREGTRRIVGELRRA
jgi:flavodoxin